jgi:hypothetical protein
MDLGLNNTLKIDDVGPQFVVDSKKKHWNPIYSEWKEIVLGGSRNSYDRTS